MRRRDFLGAAGAAAVFAAGGLGGLLSSCGRRAEKGAARRVVVLAAGGLDAGVAERLMAAGRLPNLAALAGAGTYARLRTPTPTETEPAWATFATGARPGKHGIFGKFGRDPATYRTVVADLASRGARYLGEQPVWPARYESLLCAEPFWRQAAAAGITSAAMWAPLDFPPRRADAGAVLAGWRIPDAWLSAGTYHYFSTDADFPEEKELAGGVWRKIQSVEGAGGVELEPPPGAGGEPLAVTFAPEGNSYLDISVAGQTQRVAVGNYSDYFVLPFGRGWFTRCRAWARFLVRSAAPDIRVYMAPADMDVSAPAVPVTSPSSFGKDLGASGPFSTRSRPLDIGALHDRVVSPGQLVAQYYAQAAEKKRVGLATWRARRPDLFVLCDYGLNDLAHVMWKYFDEAHPAAEPDKFYSYADAYEDAYRELDALVHTFRSAPEFGDAALLVVSPHGNRPFRRAFDLNRWLLENGYLKLKPGATPAAVDSVTPEATLARGRYKPAVDWRETKAYAVGFGHIYLNVKGRERDGVVPPGDVNRVKEDLRRRLAAARDQGRAPVDEVYDGDRLFAGPRRYAASDLVVALAEGYRVAWETVVGGLGRATFADNTGVWTGDFASAAAAAVPGLLFANVKLNAEGAAVEDVAPTVAALLGLPPAAPDGKPLL